MVASIAATLSRAVALGDDVAARVVHEAIGQLLGLPVVLPSRLANGTAPRLDDGHLAVARQGLSAPMGIESVAPTPHGAMGILPATARCGESMAIVDLTRLGPRG